jgi:hypothetical protein
MWSIPKLQIVYKTSGPVVQSFPLCHVHQNADAHALPRHKEVACFPQPCFFIPYLRLLGRGNWMGKRTIAVYGRVSHFGRVVAKED